MVIIGGIIHLPHHVPAQKWLFTKKGAGRNWYNTDMSQGMLAGQHIHTFNTSIHNAGSMPLNQPCFGRLPYQLRKSWQHETEPRWGGGRELENFFYTHSDKQIEKTNNNSAQFFKILICIYIPICDGYFYVFNQLGWAMVRCYLVKQYRYCRKDIF